MEQTRRQRRSAGAWQAVLARFSESGLTVAAFCEREGINPASFYQWRSKLGDAGKPAKSPAPISEPLTTAGFVDLGTLTARGSRFELHLDLGGGVTLRLARS